MRIRGRIAYKLMLLLALAVSLVLCFSYFTSNVGSDYITLLSSEADVVLNANNLLNLTEFKYTIKNELCREYRKDFLAIIIVTSYAGHDDLRAAHRQAISQNKLTEMGLKRVFLIAQVPPTERFMQQQQLLNEQERFQDLLQGNFHEAYRNLSYKHIMGLRWASTECARAKFIIKADDDIVFDVFHIRRYLESLEVQQAKFDASSSLLAGYILDSKPPVRNVASKWFVSEQEYPGATYPAYLSGWLYITNPKTALRLVQEAQRAPFFWIDDTWVTGILRTRAEIPMRRLNQWFSANAEFLDCCVRDLRQSNYECDYFVGPNGGDSKLIVEFLHNVEKCYFDECIKRTPEKSLNRTCVASVKQLVPEHGEAHIKEIKLR